MARKRWADRELSWWTVLATNSLPVPVSPRMSTVLSVGAICAMVAFRASILGVLPMSRGKPFWFCTCFSAR